MGDVEELSSAMAVERGERWLHRTRGPTSYPFLRIGRRLSTITAVNAKYATQPKMKR